MEYTYQEVHVEATEVEREKALKASEGWECCADNIVKGGKWDRIDDTINLRFRKPIPIGTKGKIVVENGQAIAVQTLIGGLGTAYFVSEALYETIKKLARDGWDIEGNVPPYTTERKYEIAIIKVR